VLITAFAYLFQGVVSFLLWLGFVIVAFLEEVHVQRLPASSRFIVILLAVHRCDTLFISGG
jgi:hypothetical protein